MELQGFAILLDTLVSYGRIELIVVQSRKRLRPFVSRLGAFASTLLTLHPSVLDAAFWDLKRSEEPRVRFEHSRVVFGCSPR